MNRDRVLTKNESLEFKVQDVFLDTEIEGSLDTRATDRITIEFWGEALEELMKPSVQKGLLKIAKLSPNISGRAKLQDCWKIESGSNYNASVLLVCEEFYPEEDWREE